MSLSIDRSISSTRREQARRLLRSRRTRRRQLAIPSSASSTAPSWWARPPPTCSARSTDLSIYLSIYLYLSIYPSIHLSVYLSICLPTYLCTHRQRACSRQRRPCIMSEMGCCLNTIDLAYRSIYYASIYRMAYRRHVAERARNHLSSVESGRRVRHHPHEPLVIAALKDQARGLGRGADVLEHLGRVIARRGMALWRGAVRDVDQPREEGG